MDKIVVIGGSGFMGSHTADELTKKGFDVTIFDHIKSPWLQKNQHMVVGDMLSLDDLSEALVGAKYLYILVALLISTKLKKSLDTINQNVLGAAIAMEAAQINGIMVVYASTMYVYSPYGSFYRASNRQPKLLLKHIAISFQLTIHCWVWIFIWT